MQNVKWSTCRMLSGQDEKMLSHLLSQMLSHLLSDWLSDWLSLSQILIGKPIYL